MLRVVLLEADLSRNGDLRVVDSGEVTGTRWLMLFWLERKRVRVNTRHWGGGVVDKWLNSVKVLTTLFLESVLTVEDQLEGFEWTRSFFIELHIADQNWRTRGTWGNGDVRVNIRRHQGRHRNLRCQ